MITTTSISAGSDPKSWQQNAYAEIMTVIRNKSQITYNDLALAAKITGPNKIHRLTLWLEEMMTEDYHSGRPARVAVVISKARDGLPAPGFFDKAEQLGLNFEKSDIHNSYKAYLQSVYASISDF